MASGSFSLDKYHTWLSSTLERALNLEQSSSRDFLLVKALSFSIKPDTMPTKDSNGNNPYTLPITSYVLERSERQNFAVSSLVWVSTDFPRFSPYSSNSSRKLKKEEYWNPENLTQEYTANDTYLIHAITLNHSLDVYYRFQFVSENILGQCCL